LTSCPPTPAKTAISGKGLKRHPSCSSITEEDITDEENNGEIEFPRAILTRHASRSSIAEEDILSIKGDAVDADPDGHGYEVQLGHSVTRGSSEEIEQYSSPKTPIDMVPNRWEFYDHWAPYLKNCDRAL
jgi:hypothetical protein